MFYWSLSYVVLVRVIPDDNYLLLSGIIVLVDASVVEYYMGMGIGIFW